MGKWVHRLKRKDIESKTAFCFGCNESVEIIWDSRVFKCINSWKEKKRDYASRVRRPYRYSFRDKEFNKCMICGIEDKDFRFFDVDHIDSDHKNNEKDNLQVLCPNCHRRKTIELWEGFRE